MKTINNKGITLITLILTVIILAIIASVAVSTGTNIMQSAKFENIETNLLLIRSKSKMQAESKAMGEIDESELRGKKQDTGEYAGWYKLSQADLNDMGAKDAKAEDGYYVDYENDDVAYAKGITLGDTVFYKLTEIQAYTDKN